LFNSLMNTDCTALLSIHHLKSHFYTSEGIVRAVDGVDLEVPPGMTFALVGESGCGKSVTALSILRLIASPPGRIVDGEILFRGSDLLKRSLGEMREIRGNRVAMIFQEPMTSLNPVFPVGDQVAETLQVHRGMSRKEAWTETVDLLRRVGIPSPDKRARDYPHQLSGGMRQRTMIAMAMACRPELLIADEPTTALDVTIQAQILDLIHELQEETGMAVLLITHNFGIVSENAKRVAVMYAGKIVEEADTNVLFKHPYHPYTKGLLRSIPRVMDKIKQGRTKLHEIPGIVPRLTEAAKGCLFARRCPQAENQCFQVDPDLVEIEYGHRVRCPRPGN
jgi:oligopeptide/dipeptide ABC transporter ATP-binding protein